MNEKFAKSIDHLIKNKDNKSIIRRHKQIINIVDKFLEKDIEYDILDVGEYNPFSKRLEYHLGYKIDNTTGNLDVKIKTPKKVYDLIVFSHVIEHLFNPLYVLKELRKRLSISGIMIIALPQRPKFLWTDHHFHEIDHYRMQELLKEAGFEILTYKKLRIWRRFSFYLSGIRPILRIFWKTNSIYIVQK